MIGSSTLPDLRKKKKKRKTLRFEQVQRSLELAREGNFRRSILFFFFCVFFVLHVTRVLAAVVWILLSNVRWCMGPFDVVDRVGFYGISYGWKWGLCLSIAARTCCTWKSSYDFLTSFVFAEEWRAGLNPCRRRRTFVSFLLVSRSVKRLDVSEINPKKASWAGLQHTWNEQSKLSSTLIIAPALSNSPQ